ncbi:MAG: helix-turn-helix transcriptional regulator [Bacteroidaceae bacterium]|nr:helix-turn-helix transcriptional regulator [Bacteroidaceae bacterium]
MVGLLRHIIIMCVFLMWMGNGIRAQVHQMMFERIDTYNGLGDDRVYHILQVADGRMAITTHDAVSLYDAVSFRNIPLSRSEGIRLDAYNGAYHCYVGMDNLLWIKDNHRLKCLDVASMTFVEDVAARLSQLTGKSDVVDMFCDLEGNVWCITRDNHIVGSDGRSFALPKGKGELQDLMDDAKCLYLFYSNTEVVAMDKSSGKILYSVRALDDDKYAGTSLVVPVGKGRYYQLRNGNDGGVCLCFDSNTRLWKTIFEVPYTVHTLAVSPRMAYVVTREDMWEINTTTDEAHVVEHLMLEGTPILPKHMNTVFVDNQGGVWLGSYANGLLYSHPSHRVPDVQDIVGLEDYARDKMTDAVYPLMPIVTDVTVGGVSLLGSDAVAAMFMSDTLHLEYSQRDVTLTFSSLNYPLPRLTRYLVRMADIDTLWHSPEDFGGVVDDRGCLVLGGMNFSSGSHSVEVRAVLGKAKYDRTLYVIVERSWAQNIPLYVSIFIIMVHVVLWLSGIDRRQDEEEEVAQQEMSDADREFINKARSLVVANLGAKGYSVEQLSEDLCMERTGVYKKMNALIGCSPSAFIRSIRLERAVELLSAGTMSVQDVAEAVGFNSASYMSRCFVSEYGATPLEYVKKIKEGC